jgi:hypothetical protein
MPETVTQQSTPNYGDVALNLPPDWSRSRLASGEDFMIKAIGHENGKADVYKKDHPGDKNQFQWCAKSDTNRLNRLRTKHYVEVIRGQWEKNPLLWEWDGESHVFHEGEFLMAREERFYLEDEEKRKREQAERDGSRADSREEEAFMRSIEQRGGEITDDRGRQLKPLKSARG